ncbi:MAG: hypothetical protein KDD39_10055 [Bdellovibrionales bacterium]|nr:hypothetical protein [Bdellovibrionales bacterium]
MRSTLWFLTLVLALPLYAKVDINWSTSEQQAYQYQRMQATRFENPPSYFESGCMQAVSAMSFPLQMLQTYTNSESESRWWINVLPGWNLFHAIGTSAPNVLRTLDGIEIDGMGRLSLGAPPMGGKYLPGYAFMLYEQGRDPVGIHTIPQLDPMDDLRFFAHDFKTKLPRPSFMLRQVANGLSLFMNSPLHLAIDHLIARLERAGANVDAIRDADYLILRAPEAVREETRFLTGKHMALEFANYFGVDGKLFDLIFVLKDGTEVPFAEIRMKSNEQPFIASKYGYNRFHIPHRMRRRP